MDPSFIDTDLWKALGSNLKLMWVFIGSIFILAFSLLISLGIIPSLAGSGHIPISPPGLAKLIVPLLYLTAGAATLAVVFVLVQVIPGIREIAVEIFGRIAV